MGVAGSKDHAQQQDDAGILMGTAGLYSVCPRMAVGLENQGETHLPPEDPDPCPHPEAGESCGLYQGIMRSVPGNRSNLWKDAEVLERKGAICGRMRKCSREKEQSMAGYESVPGKRSNLCQGWRGIGLLGILRRVTRIS